MNKINLFNSGEVELITTWGTEALIGEVASVSHQSDWEAKNFAVQLQFINTLISRKHFSVFEFAGVTFKLKIPWFLWKQLTRHRHSSFCIQSSRYTELSEVFIPNTFRGKSSVDLAEYKEFQLNLWEMALQAYQNALDDGMLPEHAKVFLPMDAVYVEGFVSMNLRTFMHMLKLRTNASAQQEMQELAKALQQLARLEFPNTITGDNIINWE